MGKIFQSGKPALILIAIGAACAIGYKVGLDAHHWATQQWAKAHNGRRVIKLIADNSKPASDPGKDITDDPHGPDPHGDSPHSEIHDAKLPANDPDTYFKDKPK